MAVGDFITAADYNAIRAKIAAVWGTGGANPNTGLADATFGYGQTLISSNVSEDAIIYETDWDNLRFDIYNTLFHQTGTVPSVVDISAGDLIRFGSAYPVTQYDTRSNTAITNRFNIGSTRFAPEPGITQQGFLSWVVQATVTVTVDFASAADGRYFFNSGGKLLIQSSRTDGAATQQNGDWTTLLGDAGIQYFSGTGALNYYNLTNSPQQLYKLDSSATYSQNYYQVNVYCDVANNSGGTATQVIIQGIYRDDYTTLGGDDPLFPPDDVVDGTIEISVSQQRPFGSILPSGSIAVNGPSSYSATAFSFS
jgi:hypothetical protein